MFCTSFKSLSMIVAIALVLSCTIPRLQGRSLDYGHDGQAARSMSLSVKQEESSWKHQVEDTTPIEAGHNTDRCDVTGHSLAVKFTTLSSEMNLVNSEGEICKAPADEMTDLDRMTRKNLTCSSCDAIYGFIGQLLVDLDMTSSCCLGNVNASDCGNSTDKGETDAAKAYGYGFLMILGISLLSLLGVIIVPLITNENKGVHLKLYMNTLLIAMGTSALFCSAVLHLLPKALQLDDSQDEAFIRKGVVILAALYLLYLFEVSLHSCGGQGHSHGHNKHKSDAHPPNAKSGQPPTYSSINTTSQTSRPAAAEKQTKQNEKAPLVTTTETKTNCSHGIKPLAWTIVFGDAFHNFADGLTVGAAISHSLSLGVSTTLAIAFHEIPHELGDFAILMSTGLRWRSALFLNFLSSLTAIIGFFVGVTIGTKSNESNIWILTAAIGLFLYVALVDLLPELLHFDEKGCKRLFLILMANIGFFISFVVLLLIAIYEDKFNDLINV